MERGGGNEFCAEALRDFNCAGFLLGGTGVQMGGWFRNEVRGLPDVNGLKFRIAGMGGQIFRRLGAVPALIAGTDVYPSLERGVIDAAEWVGPYDDEKLGFQRVARFYYAPSFWEPCARPPAGQPARLGPAAGRLQIRPPGRLHRGRTGDDGALRPAEPARAQALDSGRRAARAWPREVMQAGWRAGHEIMEEHASRNARFKRIWESYKPFRDDQFQWFRVAENAYDNFAFTAAAR